MAWLLLKESIGCVVFVGRKQTLVDLFDMNMEDFIVILGMDLLHFLKHLDFEPLRSIFILSL